MIARNNTLKFLMALSSFMLIITQVSAQEKKAGFIFSNNVTSFPLTGYPKLFYSQFHPGMEVFYAKKINKASKGKVFLNLHAAAFYHRFVQTSTRVMVHLNYERWFGRIALETGLGGGSGIAFEGAQVFRLQDDGTYGRKSRMRMQFIGMFAIGARYNLKKSDTAGKQIFFQFRTLLQGPFVSNYVPLLPVNSLLIGFSLPLKVKI